MTPTPARRSSASSWLLQDLRYAIRGLARSPAFTVTVVLTLGLGVGANTAMFGIIDRLMLRPFPYLRDPATVHRVYLKSTYRNRETTNSVGEYTRFLDLSQTSTVAKAAGFALQTMAVGTGLGALERRVGTVSASYFDFFDARPALGRFFLPDEDKTPRGAEVSVLSYDFWQTEFGGRDVRGERLQVWNVLTTIIGVAPKGFVGISDANPPAVYIPITTYAGSNPNERDRTTYFTRYNWGWMDMMVRRKPGISVAALSTDLSQAYVRSWDAMVAQEPGNTPTAIAKPHAVAGPLKTAAGPDPSVEARTVRWVSGIALIVLLIACSNVANLFLARALRRQRETAVRLALGVARRRLMAQWFTESLVLALIGCAAGVLIAQWGGATIRQLFVGTGAAIRVATDWRTLGVSASLAVLAAVLTGLAPALVSSRAGIADALKTGARGGMYQRSGLRTGLLVLQVTLSVVLLVGAGLFVRSFAHVRALRLGYDAEPAVLISRNLRGMQMSDSEGVALGLRLLEAAQAHANVEHASLVSSVPFQSTSSTSLFVPGIDSVRRLGRFNYQTATPDYFATMDTRILRGRPFTDADRAGGVRVAVVSTSMANVLWPGREAIGQCMRVGSDTMPCTTIIGIAEDAAQTQLAGDDRFRYYMPMSQFRPSRYNYIIARVRGDPAVVGESIRKALQPLMPGQAYVTPRPLREIISTQQRTWRFGATMFVAFGVLALVVAAVGLYGVIGYDVAQRMHELGVRTALGAQAGDLMRLVLSRGVQVAVIGVVAGTGIALAAGSKIQPLLFQQKARDPAVMGIVAAVLLMAAVVACIAPARRAATADPNLALRAD